jgi:hypothetical protein
MGGVGVLPAKHAEAREKPCKFEHSEVSRPFAGFVGTTKRAASFEAARLEEKLNGDTRDRASRAGYAL